MSTAELFVVSATIFLVGAIVAAYASDAVGLRIVPIVVLVLAITAAAAVQVGHRATAVADNGASIAAGVLVVGTFVWLGHLAGTSLLPPGSGPDVTHHLMLVDYIEQHWRLPHDPALGFPLGEMAVYPPGVHLLAALFGAWTRTDGLRAMYPLLAVMTALKAGVLFLVALRLESPDVPRVPISAAGIVLLFVPYQYFVGSFTASSFLAQVASEFFAVVMFWAAVAWADAPQPWFASVFAIAGIGAFLTWPVWVGPLVLTFAAVAATRRMIPVRQRVAAMFVALAPVAIIAAIFAIGRANAVRIVAASGYVAYPSITSLGGPFLAGGAAGLAIAAADRRARAVVWLAVAIALQAAVLYAVAVQAGADRPYQALKMIYLLIYPLAVGCALALAATWRLLARGRRSVAWVALGAIVALVGRSVAGKPRPTPVITWPMYEAGRWARVHLAPDCIDYLVADDYSAYWLHHAVLRNPRAGGRPSDRDLFDREKAVVRWILPGGRPYAIAQDFDTLPRDIRNSVDVLARFGPAAVIRRRGPGSCS